jgi:NACHT domain
MAVLQACCASSIFRSGGQDLSQGKGRISMLTQTEKRERLRKIPAEVPELHDWLHVLLVKLPNVVFVEYTHGRDEFGADFVLETLNQTSGRTEFIGVIVKKGTIKQDTAEVERQIEECGIPRIIKHGKDEQSLPLIWVVSNEGVTANAEKKLRHKYTQHAIQFFTADDMIRWTDEYAPYLWDNIPSKVSQYLESLRSRLNALDRAANLLGDQASNIELKFELELVPVDPDNFRRKKAPASVSLLEETRTRRVVFVEGEMGSGKSQLLRSLGVDLCSAKSFSDEKLLPVFSTYRYLMEKHTGLLRSLIEESLGALIAEYDQKQLDVVVIIDGLDEYSNGEESNDGSLLFHLISSVEGMDRVRGVFSCRSRVIPRALIRPTSGLRHLEVRPLSLRKVTQFIKAVCERAKLSNRIARDIGKSELFRQLPQNPIAALLLTRLMLQSHTRDELPQTLTDLYARSLELMLGRWDLDKGLGSQQEYEVSTRICGDISRYMIENRLISIATSEVEDRVKEYLRARNLTIDSRALLDRLYSRSGVLVRDESTSTASFKHRSFSEYFCAEEWLRVNSLQVDNRAFQGYWATVYFFAVGQKSDCESVLRDILTLTPSSDEERFGKLCSVPAYLLAGHMTPYRLVESTFPTLMIELSRYYLDIATRRVDSLLAVLPPVPLLYVLQLYIREKYGYQFLERR